MRRTPRHGQGKIQFNCVFLFIAGYLWFLNFPGRRWHTTQAGRVERTLCLWYKHDIAHITSSCILETQETPIYRKGRQIVAAPSISIIAPFGGVFHAPNTNVWGMSKINVLKRHRNVVRARWCNDAEDCAISIDGIGYGQHYTQITGDTRGWAESASQGGLLAWKCE